MTMFRKPLQFTLSIISCTAVISSGIAFTSPSASPLIIFVGWSTAQMSITSADEKTLEIVIQQVESKKWSCS